MQVSSWGSRWRLAAVSHSTFPTMLWLLCLLAATVTGACEAPFKVVGEGCYYFSLEHDLQLPWAEAHQYCQNLGMDLAVLDYVCDDFRNLGNYLLLQDVFLDFEITWVGATGGDETWFWVDGRSLDIDCPYWSSAYPSTSTGCAYLSYYTNGSYKRVYLGDIDCTYSKPFICQDYKAVAQQGAAEKHVRHPWY